VIAVRFRIALVGLVAGACLAGGPASQSRAAEELSLSGTFKGSPIVLRATPRNAGAIDSLVWRGKEFINDYDHGRELQSASFFNNWGQCYNPTEAGSRRDHTGPTSSSRLIEGRTTATALITRTQMAFWLEPGEAATCPRGTGAVNKTVLSDHVVEKVTTLQAGNVLEHDVTFVVPENYETATFEVITAYLPIEFSQLLGFDPATRTTRPIGDGKGGQPLPVIAATRDGQFAFGHYSSGLPQARWPRTGYGRWLYADMPGPGNATTKVNCVYRTRPVPAGRHRFTCYSVFGTLDQVTATLARLADDRRR
jgi:hypothetical protein